MKSLQAHEDHARLEGLRNRHFLWKKGSRPWRCLWFILGSFNTWGTGIRELFSQHGEVHEVTLITDRDTGRPKGLGFVQMCNDREARAVIGAPDGNEAGGRSIKVARRPVRLL